MIIHDVKQLSPEWFKLHLGMPTSSMYDSLITTTGRLPKSITPVAKKLAVEILRNSAEDFNGTKSTERGLFLEPDAISYYEFITGNKVDEVGFVTDDLIRYGASTDGFIKKDGLAEVKCLELPGHTQAVLDYERTGTIPEERKPQVQGELLVTERKWADLIFYYPDIEITQLIIRVYPDYQYQELLKSQIAAVLIERDRIVNIMRNK